MLWLLVFTSTFCTIGMGLLWFAVLRAVRARRAASWPTAPGTVTHLSLDRHLDDGDSTYRVRVSYTYTVDGVRHEGSRVAFGYAATNVREDHEQIYGRLKDARCVHIRYSPEEHALSCLSAGGHRGIRFDLAFASGWLLFCFWMIVLWWVSQGKDSVLLDNLRVQ